MSTVPQDIHRHCQQAIVKMLADLFAVENLTPKTFAEKYDVPLEHITRILEDETYSVRLSELITIVTMLGYAAQFELIKNPPPPASET